MPNIYWIENLLVNKIFNLRFIGKNNHFWFIDLFEFIDKFSLYSYSIEKSN